MTEEQDSVRKSKPAREAYFIGRDGKKHSISTRGRTVGQVESIIEDKVAIGAAHFGCCTPVK
jgi:hypothetical protein